jgi:hypothetical protein
MAAKKTTKKKYSVYATLHLQISIDVEAESMTDALEKSKALKEEDFVLMHGDYCDGHMEITGLYAPWEKD